MDLHYAELFERFLHTRYVGQKRFSLEGAETLIPLLDAIVEKAAELRRHARSSSAWPTAAGSTCWPTSSRKPYEEIFAEFEDNYLPDSIDGDGDVKYHLGFSSDRVTAKRHSDPPVADAQPQPPGGGRSGGRGPDAGQAARCSATPSATRGIPLLIHGDAAFAGQGLVAETLNLSQLAGYTHRRHDPRHRQQPDRLHHRARATPARRTYCTDVAKMIQVPIFHVNGEDPEAAVYVAELALEFRQTFHRDVVIDMYCYRRHGHNEGDEPSFTQPLMYGKIENRPTLSRDLHRAADHARRPDGRRDRGDRRASSRTSCRQAQDEVQDRRRRSTAACTASRAAGRA